MAKKYNYNLSILTNEDDISYYILGLFITDGCIMRAGKSSWRMTLTNKNKKIINDIKKLIAPKSKIYKQGNCYILSITNKKIGEWFIGHNCLPRKTFIVDFPSNIPEQYIPDFIRGCFDGDGSMAIYKDKRQASKNFLSYICGSSINLLNNIQKVLYNYNIKSSITEVSKYKSSKGRFTHKHWRLQFSKLNTLKFLAFIYYDDHKLSLSSKTKTFQRMKNIYQYELKTGRNHIVKSKLPSYNELINMKKQYTLRQMSIILGVSIGAIQNRLYKIIQIS